MENDCRRTDFVPVESFCSPTAATVVSDCRAEWSQWLRVTSTLHFCACTCVCEQLNRAEVHLVPPCSRTVRSAHISQTVRMAEFELNPLFLTLCSLLRRQKYI